MRKIITLTALTTLAAFSLNAQAADNGLYIGAGVGAYTLEIDDTDFDDNDTVAKVFAGYRFNKNLAVEGEYQKLFESEDDIFGTNVELEADAWTIAVRPILPLTDFIDLYAKIGYTHYEAEARTRLGGVTINDEDSESGLNWGGGIDFNLGNVSLRGEVSRIEIDDADLNLVSAGVVFRF
ncbi:MAG: porin family protein [Pseudomonadales bacterium]